MIKSFTKYILTLVAILMVTTPAWAATTCHTVTKTTFTTDKDYKGGFLKWTTYYYYSQPQQQFLQINDNGYSTLSSVTFTVTGDNNDGAQTFKILYNTGSGWQYYDNTNYSLSRGGLLQGYPAGSTTITLSDTKIKSATAFGIEFTNYNTNSSGNTNKRTITISNVSVTFSPYFHSDANGTTLEEFPSTEKGTPCSTTRSFTYKYNNTVTSVNWVSSNLMFTVSSTHADDCNGEKGVTITFTPTEIRSEITGTITGTDNNGNKIVVYVKGSSWGKEDPTYTWKPEIWNGTSQARTIYVGETINDMLSYTSSPADCTYTIEKLQDFGTNNGDATTTFTNNILVAGRAGEYKLTVRQPAHSISATSGYNAGETTIILTISKRETSFDWALADTYWVDDQITEESIITNKTNNEVAISVSDSQGFFTYSNNTLEANGNTMPSGESHTTTITVTQAENYKWTKHTLTKQITLKRHTISAKINQTTAVWNELINNPFSASSTHPVSGQVTPINDFTVTQEGNEHIAQLNNSNYNIQTYYTDGLAQFKVKRDEDYKYNPLNQTFDLNVQKDKNGCYAIYNASTKNDIDNKQNATSEAFPLIGAGNTLTFKYKLNSGVGDASYDHYITPQYSVNGKDFTPILKADGTPYTITTRERNDYTTSEKIVVPQDATHINFLRTAANGGNRTIKITEINVTRASFLTPSVHTLILDPTIKNKLSEKSFTVDWSTCADEIKVMSNNQYLTVNISKIDVPEGGGRGTAKITVSCQTDVIQKHEGVIAIFDNTQMIEIPVSCEVKDLTVPEFKGDDEHKMEVGDTWEANFEFIRTQSYIPTFSETAESTGFYYYIEHNVTTDNTTGSEYPDKVIQYNPTYDPNTGNVTNNITALNEGTAILHIIQKANNEYEGGEFTCTLTVSKRTPVFTWNDPVYFNQTTISDYFITNNTDTDIKIESQSDTDVAKLYFNPNDANDKHTLDLTTYYKETTPASSTTVTVSQAENWYWYAKEDTHTITPQNRNNHLSNTPITEANLNDFKIEYQDPWNKPWTSDGIHFGQKDAIGDNVGGWNWDDKYIIIEFTGVPDELSFITTATQPVLGMGGSTTGNNSNLFFYVSEGTSATNWTKTWEYTERDNNIKVKLNPNTRFLKLCFTGNLEGWFKNVKITELNEFRAVDGEEKDVETIDLGTENQVGTHTTANFNFKYANAGYKVKFEIVGADDAATTEARKYITLSHASLQTINGEQYITNIGGEKYGTVESIQVDLYTEKEEYVIPDGTIIRITDETGIHLETIKLTGSILRSDQELYWQGIFLKDPVILPLTVERITGIAKSSRDLEVTYESSNPEVIEISDDGKYLTPLKEGEVIITAKQEGNYLFNPATPISKPVIVTGKTVQVIICTDDLSDLVQGSAPIELSAKVYIIDLENQGKLQYNEEQTAKLQYEVSDPSVASLEGNVLTPIGLGTATLTITVPGDETYKEDKITVPIRVRPATAGCEDILLVNHRESQEFFAFDLARPEVISKIDTIDLSKGIPGTLDFQYSGKPWKLGIEYYGGEIVAEQSIDGKNWSEIITITPTKNQTESSVDNKLDRNAKYIRFRRPQGGIGYHYVSNIKVYPAQYIETDKTIIDYGQIHIGTQQEFTFNVNYSNIKHELSPKIYLAPDQIATDVVLSQPTQPFGDCGAFGTQTVSGIWTPKTGGLSTERSIVFTDAITGLSATVVLKADVLKKKQHIIWDDAPTTIDDYTDINSRPAKTKNDLNEDVLDITYEVVEGKDYAFFEDGVFYIKGTGDIVIRAYNDGNFEYEAVEKTFPIKITGMPPTFAGGGSDNKWTNIENWVDKIYPETPEKYAVILADAVIDESIQVNQLLVSDEGSVHITSTGGLTVGTGGIQCSKTDGSAIVIDNLHSGAGFLRVAPTYEGTMPRITMRYQTRSTLDNGANKDAEWQYIGAPGLNSTIYVDYNTWLYKLDEPNSNWVLQPRVDSVSLDPFEGYAITQYGKPIYEWTADMTTENCTIPLTYSKNGRSGRHIIANSYTAPINVAAFTGDEFQFLDGKSTKYRIEQTLYIFNSGSWNNWNTAGQTATGSSAGQYYAIPVKAAAAQYMTEDIGEQTTIAPMQGIYLRVRSLTPLNELPEAGEQVGNLVLNYEQLVMGSGHEMHRPMRAPQRTTSSAMQDPNFRRVRIVATSENSGADRVYIIQDNINTRKYNNGYDATNQEAKGLVNIYTNETGGKMEVSCSNNIDSMYIGFMAGSDHTYTLHFSAIIGDILYLQDLDNGQKISIVEGGSYTFEAEPQSTNHKRFLLLTSQGVSTGTDEVALANIWYTNKALHITNAPNNSTLTLYDISGHQLLSTTIQETPYTLDLSHLTEGIYIARLNNQVYKFVCK